MKTHTISITVAADRDRVFEYLARYSHLPEWASALCARLVPSNGYHLAHTSEGEHYISLISDRATGVIDLFWGEHPDEMMLLPLRVVSLPHGAAVTLTCFQPAGMAHEVFERLHLRLLDAMRSLARRFEGGEVFAEGVARPAFSARLVTGKFYETWDFYTAILGFRTVSECDAFVQLAHPSGAEFGLHRHESDGMPAELISSTDGRGFWLRLTVTDADEEFARLEKLGVEILEPLEDKSWGERQFMVRDPNGVVIQIAHRFVPPSALLTESLVEASA